MPQQYNPEDAFTIAKRAAWAGDVDYCRSMLSELHRLTLRVAFAKNTNDPVVLLARAGEKLQARIKGRESPPDELLLETEHLRGVVWQIERREFELLAYLTDNEWEEELHRHAHGASKHHGAKRLESEDEDEDPGGVAHVARQEELFPQEERAELVNEGTGLSWEEEFRGLVCTVVVSELGLIKVRGLWLLRDMLESAAEIVNRFEVILSRIEEPDSMEAALDLPDNERQP